SGQVSRIDVDEASDIVYSQCSENQFSVFIFRYPEIGELESTYSNLVDKFSLQPSVFMVDIRMEPIPGCSRPKLFDLCGYTTLNPYMKYKPFLAFVSNTGSRWSDFSKSEYYRLNKSIFLPVTDKEGNRAPFLNVNNTDALKVLLDFLNKREAKNYTVEKETPKPPKLPESSLDSAKIYLLIAAMFDSRKPVDKPIRGYFGVRVSAIINGRFRSTRSAQLSGSDKDVQNVVADVSYLTGDGFAISYESPLVLPSVRVNASQRIEVGLQSVSFSSDAIINNQGFTQIFTGVNMFASYSLHREIPLAAELNLVLGAGANVVHRLPYTISGNSKDYSSLETGIELWDFGLFVNGGLRHTFRSQNRVFLDLGYNMGLLNFDSDVNSTDNYKF
ncbi:MAG: hypothetical protein ACKO55_11925, partial [Bacteroidota bacterium]